MILSSITTVIADNITDIGPFVLLTGLATALIGYIVYALITGSIVTPNSHRGLGQSRYMRDARPGNYWFNVVWYTVLAGGLFYAASELNHKWIGELFSK